MRYADTLLIEGEDIALRTRQHWLAFVINARFAFVLWVVGIGLLFVPGMLNLPAADVASQVIGWIVLAAFAIGLAIFAIGLWQWWAQDYIVTSRRLMKVWGVLNKQSVDSSLEKINDARLEQSLLGRLLNYGDLDILTASTETEIDDYEMIHDPKGFKRVMLTQKHALEQSYYRGAPSPPLRASMDMNGEPVAQTSVEPAAESEPIVPIAAVTAPDAPDASLEITRALTRLADLRDRGTITDDEFQAKKQELLGRL